MSPFAGLVETPWLNPELSEAAGRSAGGKSRGDSSRMYTFLQASVCAQELFTRSLVKMVISFEASVDVEWC
jgi:hypothetical protein